MASMDFSLGPKKNSLPPLPPEALSKIDTVALHMMPHEVVDELQAFVFAKNDKGVKAAAVNPTDHTLQLYMKEHVGERIQWFAATKHDIALFLRLHIRNFAEEIDKINASGVDAGGNIAKLADMILEFAFREKASDVHIEPLRDKTVIRFRVDGTLRPVATLRKSVHTALVSRFKILADMKIDEFRRPQDGRIEPEHLTNISLRISTIPTMHGEKMALRVLDDSSDDLTLQQLGFSPKQEDILLRQIEKPFGMIVTSGPTGSGKTTTLYALLRLLKKGDVNVSTLEDPIEHSLPGINQIQVNPRVQLTFASGLRALLRQDPDVIMVGEIRDSETSVMAGNAAMTGHLVFTTIHTNDAPSVFTRFLEMKMEDFVVASAVNTVIAQRLVRKICSGCKTEKKIDGIVVKRIKERKDILASIKTHHKMDAQELSEGLFFMGAGCDGCLNTGYAGRTGIYEVLEVDKKIRGLVLKHASVEQVKTAAAKEGFRDMIADGVDKVFAGITTFEEVLRGTRA